MKKTTIITLSALALSIGASAQSKFDLPAAHLVGTAQSAMSARSASGPFLAPAEDKEYTVIVKFTSTEAAEQAYEFGYPVVNVRADMALMQLTPAQMEELAKLPEVKQIALGEDLELKVNVAREATGVDAIHSGTGLGQAYTGKGVVVGLMDTGLDPNHANFTVDGELRIKRLWSITGSNGAISEYDTPAKIKAFTTDYNGGTHATHVLGIMAGSFNKRTGSNGSTAIVNSNGSAQISTIRPNPYYGVAKDAEIAACCGTLQGNNIITALEKISAYSKEVGKPAVMNLSLGNNSGPHDGTDTRSQYMAEVGKEMLICVSAGNEGTSPVSLHKDFTASDKIVRTTVGANTAVEGHVEIWGNDATIFNVTLAAVDKTTGEIKYSYKVDKNLEGNQVLLTSAGYTNPGTVRDPEMGKYFGDMATVWLNSNIDTNNKRYTFSASFDFKIGSVRDVMPAFIIEGQAGKSIDMFSNVGLYSNKLNGFTQGDDTNSINGMACGDNILVVGAYTNRQYWPVLEGDMYGYRNATVGDIAYFSSYGKTFQGRQLPDITGPGMGMVSSYSYYYVSNGNDMDATSDKVDNYFSGKYTEGTGRNQRTSYWKEMSGTSMSSPFVAGVLALWLEADPSLKISDVKDILAKTAKKDEYTAKNPERWGMGKIDALAGIKEVLARQAGVSDVAVEANKMIISEIDGRTFEVFAAGAGAVEAQLYSMSGALAATASASGDTATLSAASVAPGIYILKATANGTTETHKLIIR